MSHGNTGYQPIARTKPRNQRPPAGEQGEQPKHAKQRVRAWQRRTDKRNDWQAFAD